MRVKWIGPYPPVPSRKLSEDGTSRDEHESSPQERSDPKKERTNIRNRLSRWADNWGADLLLMLGAGCVSAGAGWIYPPAGLIAGGVLLIAGGVLWSRGKGDDGP